MAGLVPAIHVSPLNGGATWMPATSVGMTVEHSAQLSWIPEAGA
jgi:hypothetical protein